MDGQTHIKYKRHVQSNYLIRLSIIPAFYRTDGKDISFMVSQEQMSKEKQEKYLKQSEQERELRQLMHQKNVQFTPTYH